jgi:cation diffusion facilitator family transporter
MSAAFEGGLISFAALLTGWYAVVSLLGEPRVEELDLGLGLTMAAGLVNAVLGMYLVRAGRRVGSIVLMADGQHLLADFKTSVGVVLGLGLVWLTGLAWLDPLTALVVGANLGWTGVRLVRESAGGLLDAEDTELLGRLVGAFRVSAFPGIIRIHRLRAIRSGQITHADAHLIVPEYWSVERAHAAADAFERGLLASGTVAGEIIFHTDPCRRALCRICDVQDCPVRRKPFLDKPPLTLEEATEADDSFWSRWD